MKYLLANFKTNKNWKELQDYFNDLTTYFQKKRNLKSPKIIFFLNNLYILLSKNNYKDINFGCQSGSHLGNGAFTSSVSLEQQSDEKIKNILLGHSEEYEYFRQTIPIVNKKLTKALSLNFKIFLCFGNLNEIENFNELINELMEQLFELLKGIDFADFKNIVLAYEPIYTIGSGKSMNPTYANNIIATLKEKLFNSYNYNFPIIYGGSVNVENIAIFFDSPNIDGVLVGKESLDINKMKEMISINERKK